MSRNIPITEFDTLTVNPSMQILKALIPFLDYPLQRQVSLIIRVTELQQTMKFFSNPSSVSVFSSSGVGYADKIHSIDDIFNNEKLLDSLLVYCPENYASMIKTFRQFSKMSDLFNIINPANEDTGDDADSSSKSSDKTDRKPSGNSSQGINLNNLFSSAPGGSLLNSFMKPEQQAMYNEYIRQLNSLNFDEPDSKPEQ